MPWTSEPSLSNSRQGLAAATCDAPSPASGYRIYAIGGNGGSGPVATVEAYNPASPGWSAVVAMPTPRLNLAATAGTALIYALGGTNGIGPLATHEIYNPAAGPGGAWSSAPPLPTARSGLGAATGRDGNIYALGGYDGSYLTTVEAFDPTTMSWLTGASAPPAMPTARSGVAAVTGPDGRIYAIAGQNSSAQALTTVEAYDTTSRTWSTVGSLPDALYAPAAAVGPDGLIYVMGGVDASGISQSTVYSYDPATSGPWVAQPSLPSPQAFLAAATGPDGLIYAIGGQNLTSPALGTVEAFSVAVAQAAPDPYIGDGTYQSPDIVLLDTLGNPIPIGGAPGGAWDTLLLPGTNYALQAVVYNDSNAPASGTIVGFWHFPGGVGTAGVLIDNQTVTVPANSSIVVSSPNPFLSGSLGEHECVAVSVANPASPYFSTDPTTGTAVISPTVPHPAGSGRFGSAWRNTNSVKVAPGGMWRFRFRAGFSGIDQGLIRIVVAQTKVPADWERLDEIVRLRKALQGARAVVRLPLFLVPEVRKSWPAGDCELKIETPSVRGGPGKTGTIERKLKVDPGASTPFIVALEVPRHARKGEIYLVNVRAHYAGRDADPVEYLEVVYVK
jgi:Kelch motif